MIFFKKYLRYEFWPFWLLYGPLTPWFIYKIIKTKAPAYFCNANPGILWGGFINYSKYDLIKQIDKKYIPTTVFYKNIKNEFNIELPFNYPFIVKPDIGERGKEVELIKNEKEWNFYLNSTKKDLIIQEYIDYPLEFGIFYVRMPKDNLGKIISITAKEFLIFKGDGITTYSDFINTNYRASLRKEYLTKKFEKVLDDVLPKGEQILIEPIGNHNRGTIFLDASNLNTPLLENEINNIAKNIDGFFYGRFDVKAKSIDELKKGNFIILEVNGTNSEATHIYDPKHNLIFAYKEILRHLNYQYRIAKENKKLAYKYPNWIKLAKELLNR